jgi:hypothetical protein
MRTMLKEAFDRVTGRGSAAVTIPAMDGALQPNTRLEDAKRIFEIEAPDNLVAGPDRIYFSSGNRLFVLEPSFAARPHLAIDANIAAVAVAADGTLAIGLDDGRIVFEGGSAKRSPITRLGSSPLKCPTALAFADSGTLIICVGSQDYAPGEWQHSVMARDATGSVWKLDMTSGHAERLAGGLAYPYGILVDGRDGAIVISESWRHRLMRFTAKAKPVSVLENLPGYPARLSRASDGGAWLSVVAPRSQLIEFVLREPAFRSRMMAEIEDPNMWVAPSLFSRRNFLEPMQGGALKQMGILKPWAPGRSYGLVIKLDSAFLPVDSLHSRTDGTHHGIRSAIEIPGAVLAASGGGNAILKAGL